jgi:hypothetical protein
MGKRFQPGKQARQCVGPYGFVEESFCLVFIRVYPCPSVVKLNGCANRELTCLPPHA